jgi:hypothetical protein
MPRGANIRSAARVGLVAFVLLGCSSGNGLVRCAADGGGAPCAADTECLWLHGGGSFCVATCATGLCTDGRSCQIGAASSCATCDDLIDVCE